mgnify:CR=1 FL=1
MKNNFKGGMSSNLSAFDVAKKWKISPVEFIPILEKGTEHEMEHTDDKDIARRIALDHIVERLDYYDQLDKIEKMEKGGEAKTFYTRTWADGTIENFSVEDYEKNILPHHNNPEIRFEKGGKTISQTPAPASDRVSGSKKNPKGSASDSQLAKSITFNDSLLKAIENKVKAHNEEYPSKKVTIPTAKAVVRRGMGAYSKSHRPFITGGAPNSRQAWGLARLNKFLLKKRGVKVKSAYIQDDDLL